MTPEDPIDRLGARLFQAARQEPLPDSAQQRAIDALRIQPLASSRTAWLDRSRWVGVLALAAGILLGVWHRHREPAAAISAEPTSSLVPSHAPDATSKAASSNDAPAAVVVTQPTPSAEPATAPPPPLSPTARSAPATLTDELGALKLASSALSAGDAHAALAALDQYDHLTGRKMQAEATLLRIEALSRAGQARAASDLARRFVAQNSESPLVDRARSFVQQ